MIRRFSPLFALVLLLVACSEQKEYAYLKDAPRNQAMPIRHPYAAVIMPGDLLHIDVYSQSAEAARPFNQESNNVVGVSATGSGITQARGYRVGSDGSIAFPMIGRLQLAGLEQDSAARLIERRLLDGGFIDDPLVTISQMDFTVVVIGEVVEPRELHTDGTRLTIFEALAQCGDVTLDALPAETVVVRRTLAGQTVDTIDLTSATLLDSPYYYLRQNDIVYVPPTPKKRRLAYRNEDWPRYFDVATKSVSLAYRTIYTIVRVEQLQREANR